MFRFCKYSWVTAFVTIHVRDFELSWSNILIELFRLSVTDSDESGWDIVTGESAFPTIRLLCLSSVKFSVDEWGWYVCVLLRTMRLSFDHLMLFICKRLWILLKGNLMFFRVLFLSFPKFLEANRHFIFWLSIIVIRCCSVFSSALITNVEIPFILISGFYRGVNEIFALLGCYAA